jgi:hypothetical protein
MGIATLHVMLSFEGLSRKTVLSLNINIMLSAGKLVFKVHRTSPPSSA